MEKLPVNKRLVHDLKQVIEQARSHVAATVNAAITIMYWHIGERINREVLGNERADYGKQIVPTVSTQLQELLGSKGFEKNSITRMMRFAVFFPDFAIVSQAATQLQELYGSYKRRIVNTAQLFNFTMDKYFN